MIEGKKANLALRIGLLILEAVGLVKLAGCNESYLTGAAARGYGLRSGTAEGAASGAILGDYFESEGNRETALDSRTQICVNPEQPNYSNDESWRYNPDISKAIEKTIRESNRWKTDPAVSAAIKKTLEDAKNGVRPVGPYENFVKTHPEYENIPWIKEGLKQEKTRIDEQMKKNEPIRRRNQK